MKVVKQHRKRGSDIAPFESCVDGGMTVNRLAWESSGLRSELLVKMLGDAGVQWHSVVRCFLTPRSPLL